MSCSFSKALVLSWPQASRTSGTRVLRLGKMSPSISTAALSCTAQKLAVRHTANAGKPHDEQTIHQPFMDMHS